ncbi:MAG: DUF2029 domain-containing protein [Dysgonamonadaceae bacterium]|jgi:hypothetical protein|nr:DUF2029 domain-containing protein [Dysgonamonadaceae bacterium]
MKQISTNKIYWALGVLFLVIYYGIIYQNTSNIPRWDDFDAFFKFVCDYIDSPTFGEKLALIFEPHGLHRIVFTRLLALSNYYIISSININALIVIGNLFMLGIGAMFFVFLRQRKDAGIFALMIVLLLFNGQNFETNTWAMAGLANVGTLLLSMLSVYFVMQPTKAGFVAGIVLSVITVFSNGNGMCLFPAVLFSFLLQKRKKELLWFAGIVGVAIICYFLNFNWESGSERSLRIDTLVMGFFYFLGGNAWLPSVKFIALLWGLFIFATYVWAIVGGFYRKNPVWFTSFTFMLLTAAMVVLNRSVEEIAPLRYRIYCCMGTILTVMFYFENRDVLHLTRWFKFLVPPIMLFSLSCSLLYLDKCEKFSEYKKVTAYNWQRDRSGLCPNNHGMEEILQRAEDMNIYKMPVLPLKALESKATVEQNWQNRNSKIVYNIDFLEDNNEYILIKGWAYTDEMEMDFTDIFLWLINKEQSEIRTVNGSGYNIKAVPYSERRYDLAVSDLTVVENCGFFAAIPKTALLSGDYKLGIEIQKRYIVPVKKSSKSAETNVDVQIKKLMKL